MTFFILNKHQNLMIIIIIIIEGVKFTNMNCVLYQITTRESKHTHTVHGHEICPVFCVSVVNLCIENKTLVSYLLSVQVHYSV